MKIIIRRCKLKKNETKKIMKVIYSSFFTYNQNNSKKKLCEKIERIYGSDAKIWATRKRFLKSEILLIAKKDKKIIGIIRGKKHFIRSLYIEPGILGLGIGSKLIKEFEKLSKSYGSKEIKLRTSVFANNFYIKQGYKTLKENLLYKKL